MNQKTELYRQFLKFFWLRPENAIMFGVRADAYASTLPLFDSAKKTMDVSCGDGVFSFITLGGRFTSVPDQFRAVSTEQTFRSGSYDAFDQFDETYLVEIDERPDRVYSCGSDWKQNMIRKARALDFYEDLIEHDNNQPLPYDGDQFGYIYSNSSYWVNEFEVHLRDLIRLAKPGGHIVLQMRTNKIKDYSLAKVAPEFGSRFHEITEAGRLSTWRGLRSRGEIMRMLDGFSEVEIVRDEPVLGRSLSQIWNLGLRPLFNPLVKMSNAINVDLRTEIKEEWCQIFDELFSEFVGSYECSIDEAFEFLLVLKKS